MKSAVVVFPGINREREIKSPHRKQAEALLRQAADKQLPNTIIEDYRVEVK